MRRAEDMILISVDDHIAEPADMFDQHVPAKYKDQAPRVVTDERGFQQWWYGEKPGRNLGLNAVAGKPPEMFNVNPTRYEEMRPGCYDVHERVRDMSAGGQLAGLNFPNWTGFSGQVLNEGPDLALNELMIKAYNDWHVDEWCATYPERFVPCGILPLFDVDKAAAEVRRLAAKGCHAVTFSENPAALHMPSIHSGHWDPLFAVCSDEGTVLCCHVGSSSKSASTSPDAPPSVGMSLSSVMSTYSLGDLMWADFWWRYPDLRFSLTEGDIGWIPYFLQRAEHIQDKHSGWTQHHFPEGYGPAAVFRERSCAASSTTRWVSACWTNSTWTTSAGSRTTRTRTAPGRTHPKSTSRCSLRWTTRWSTASRTATPCATSPSTPSPSAHRRRAPSRRCAPRRPTWTRSPAWVAPPTRATATTSGRSARAAAPLAGPR